MEAGNILSEILSTKYSGRYILNLTGTTPRSPGWKWLWGKGLGYIKKHGAERAPGAHPRRSVSFPEAEIQASPRNEMIK